LGIQIASALAKGFIFLFAIVAPPLILAGVSSMAARLATISVFTGVLIVLLLWMIKDLRSTDVFMISATYGSPSPAVLEGR
jgi:predicted membrane-bound mannosyltransferase